MARNATIHWAAPFFTVSALLCGVLFSIGHHLFYQSLDGKAVAETSYNFYVTDTSAQQLNVAIGTAFAFLVKASLVAAMTIVYAQLFWRKMAYGNSKVTLGSIDTAFAALENVFVLFKVKTWYRFPFLFLVAGLCWLLPLAAIVTPATLTVRSAPKIPPPSTLIHVPSPGYTSLKYLNTMDIQGLVDIGVSYIPFSGGTYNYEGPSAAVGQVAMAVATTGEILPFNAPRSNSTWKLNFPGPSLRCSNISGSDRDAILQNTAAGSVPTISLTNDIFWDYISWRYGWSSSLLNSTSLNTSVLLPLAPGGSTGFGLAYHVNHAVVNRPGPMPAQVYVFARNPVTNQGTTKEIMEHGNTTIVKCNLVNATYDTNFTFVNGEQRIRTTTKPMSETPMMFLGSVAGPHYKNGGHSDACSHWNEVLHEIDGPACTFNSTLVNSLSYQAVFDAFTQIIQGSMYTSTGVQPLIQTQVQRTVLVNSPELQFLRSVGADDWATLQSAMASSNTSGTLLTGFQSEPPSTQEEPLTQAMESLFQKIVISLISRKDLQADPASRFSPPPTNVTFEEYHNIYVYSSIKLWAAYGIAILITTAVCIIGFCVIFIYGASYSFNFSTIFRFAWGASLNKDIKREDATAVDPLPSYLVGAEVTSNSSRKKQQQYAEAKRTTAQERLL